jgi:hypothetical protein
MGNLGRLIMETTPYVVSVSHSSPHYLLLLFSIFILPILPTAAKGRRIRQLDG